MAPVLFAASATTVQQLALGAIGAGVGLLLLLGFRAWYFRVGRIVSSLERIEARLAALEAASRAPQPQATAPVAALGSVVEAKPWEAPSPAPVAAAVPAAEAPATPVAAAPVPAAPVPAAAVPAAPVPVAPVPAAAIAEAPTAAAPADAPDPSLVKTVVSPVPAAIASGAVAPPDGPNTMRTAQSSLPAALAAGAEAKPEPHRIAVPVETPVAPLPALLAAQERRADKRLTEPDLAPVPPPAREAPPAAAAPAEAPRPPTAEVPWVKKKDTEPGVASTRPPEPAAPAAPAPGQRLVAPPEGSRYCPYCGQLTSKRNLFCAACQAKLPA